MRLSAFGDIVHSAHAVGGLKRALPACRIGWLVEDRYADLVRMFQFVDDVQVLRLKSGVMAAVKSLARVRRAVAGRYELVVDLQGLLKSAVPARLCAGRGRLVGFGGRDAREGSRFLYCEQVTSYPAEHVAERQARLLSAAVGVEVGLERRLPVRLPAAPVQPARPYVMLIIGSAWPNKVWPPEHFAALAELLVPEYEVYAAGGAAEREVLAWLAARSPVLPAPPLSIPALAAMLAGAAAVVGSDTGPVHLASALGTPVVVFYGPTLPADTTPLGPEVQPVSTALDCRGCWRRRCGREAGKHAPCMSGITPAQVREAVHALLAAGG